MNSSWVMQSAKFYFLVHFSWYSMIWWSHDDMLLRQNIAGILSKSTHNLHTSLLHKRDSNAKLKRTKFDLPLTFCPIFFERCSSKQAKSFFRQVYVMYTGTGRIRRTSFIRRHILCDSVLSSVHEYIHLYM